MCKLKYLLKKQKKLILVSFFSGLLISCGSTKVQNQIQDDKSVTFVNTAFSEDGKIYTTCIFSDVSYVGKKVMKNKNDYDELEQTGGTAISPKNYSYDKKTGELVLSKTSDKKIENIFHVKGVYENPPIFALAGNLCEYPLVAVEGKRLVRGKDYVFDSNDSIITLKHELDLNEASFSIHWYTMKRECVFENNYQKYETEYDKFISDWHKEME